MTGFARNSAEFTYENKKYSWVWEIKSVNAKGLDIKTRIPFWLEAINEAVKSVCAQKFARGTISISLDISSENSNPDIEINTDLLNTLTTKIKQIYLSEPELFAKPSPAELLKINGVVKINENTPDEEEFEFIKQELLNGLEQTVIKLKEGRIKEGSKIAGVLNSIL